MKKSCVWICLLLGLRLFAQNQPLTSFDLPNGLKVILSPMEDMKSVCLFMYHATGVRDDAPNMKGVSLFLQHFMLWEGTENVDPGEKILMIRKNGGFLDGVIKYDQSYFYEIVPDSELTNSIWLEKERIHSLRVAENTFENMKNNNYRRYYNLINSSVDFRALSWVRTQVFENTIYAVPVTGDVEQIRSFTFEELKNSYNRYQSLANMIMVISGKIDNGEIKQQIEKNFQNLDSGKFALRRKYTVIEPRKSHLLKNWLEDNLAMPFAIYGLRAPGKLSLDYLIFECLRYYLLDNRIAKLYELLNTNYSLNVRIESESSDNFETNALTIKLISRNRPNLERAKDLLNRRLQELGDKKISDDTFRQVKTLIELDFYKKMAIPEQRCLLLAEHFHLFGNLDVENSLTRRLSRLNSYDLVRIAKKYLNRENWVILNVYPK